MAILEIIQPDNPILRKKASKVTDFGSKLQKLIDDMYDTMMDAPGVGIAAPQVAESHRLILVRLPDDEEGKEEHGQDAGILHVVANPQIVERDNTIVSGIEGCLSLPDLLGDVDRHESIVVSGQDRNGKPIQIRPKFRAN